MDPHGREFSKGVVHDEKNVSVDEFVEFAKKKKEVWTQPPCFGESLLACLRSDDSGGYLAGRECRVPHPQREGNLDCAFLRKFRAVI